MAMEKVNPIRRLSKVRTAPWTMSKSSRCPSSNDLSLLREKPPTRAARQSAMKVTRKTRSGWSTMVLMWNRRQQPPLQISCGAFYQSYLVLRRGARAHPENDIHAAKQICYSATDVQLASGSNSLMAVAVSFVVFPKSFWNNMPSWLMMNVITPELPYSAG